MRPCVIFLCAEMHEDVAIARDAISYDEQGNKVSIGMVSNVLLCSCVCECMQLVACAAYGERSEYNKGEWWMPRHQKAMKDAA